MKFHFIKAVLLPLSIIFQFFASGQTIQVRSTDKSVEVLYDQKRVMLYVFGTDQLKPYVKELYTLDGRNILLDAPPDHLHHHGLMYAITVNGINFWEETEKSGVEYPLSSISSKSVKNDRITFAEFTHEINWVSRTNRDSGFDKRFAFLIENRTLRLIVEQNSKTVLLEWTGRFKVGDFADKVILTGTDYHGLGLRFERGFDKVTKHFNPKNLPYPTGGKHDLIETPWAAVHCAYKDKPITVAMFTHPDVAGDSIYFSMIEPFAYLSATQGINKKPLVYSKGESFSIRYLILLNENELTARDLNQIMKDWIDGKYD